MSKRFGDQNIEFSNGVIGKTMHFESANPTNYAEVMSNRVPSSKLQIDGKLFLPQARTPEPFPLVVIVPGSLEIAPSHLSHAESLTNLGIAAFVIDPLGARAISSTVANQTQFSFATSAFDVVAALKYVAKLPEIDSTRIGAQGHSRGGTAVLSAAMRAFSDSTLTNELAFKAIYSVYPWCGHQFLNPRVGDTRIRIVIGERDGWCSPQQAQGYAQAIRLAGGDVSFRLFAEAEHSFDRETPIEMIHDAAIAPNAPTVYIADTGAMVHPVTGEADQQTTDMDLMIYAVKAGFGVTGASIGGAGDQPAQFKDDMLKFWSEAMLD